MIKLLYLEILYGAAGAREVFEDLCYELIKSQFPGIEVRHIQRKKGDGGIDVHIGDLTDPQGIEVFQAKFFDREVGESQKDQIRKSFNRCVTNTEFKVSKWTLCLPRNLSLDEAKWFADWKKEAARASGLPIRSIILWDAHDLERILDEPDNVSLKEKYFNQEQLARIREMHGMLIELTKEIYNFMGGPTQETVKMQLVKYLESNLKEAEVIFHTYYPVRRFSLAQQPFILDQVASTFPELYNQVFDAFHVLEQGDRLAEIVVNMFQTPKMPTDNDSLDGFTADDLNQNALNAIVALKRHISEVIKPQLQTLLDEVKNL